MNYPKYCVLTLMIILTLACRSNMDPKAIKSNEVTLLIQNPANIDQIDGLIHISASKVRQLGTSFKIGENGFIPYQINDRNGDGEADDISILVDVAKNATKKITINPLASNEVAPVFKKRTQAEISHKINGYWKNREYIGGAFLNVDYLKVPPEHTDHSWYIRYEGPGWESDKIGYRFYLDWRNATDIFAKKTDEMVLQSVGQDGFDSYHEPADWGMDVLKVGSSLGIGALGVWKGDKALRVEKTDSVDCRIVLNGPIESLVRTHYFGWDTGDGVSTVTSDISIAAGSRHTVHDISLSHALPNLCTGIVKHPQGKLMVKSTDGWSYIATWGEQSLAEDKLGMVVFYRNEDLIELTEDEHSHVVVLSPKSQKLNYRYLATWEQDQDAIDTRQKFESYLEGELNKLNNAIKIQ